MSRRGLCHVAAQLVDSLAVHCDATLIAPNGTADYVERGRAIEIDLPFRRWNPLYAFGLLKIILLVRKYKPDIVHIQDLHPLFYITSLFFGKARVVLTLHDINEHPGEELWYASITRKMMFKRCSAIVIHGRSLRDLFVSRYPDIENKLYVLYHPVNRVFDKWRSDGVQEEKQILFFGRIVKYKGLDILLKSVPMLRKALPDYKVIVAGSGDISEYTDLLKECGDYVVVDNRQIPDDVVARYYQKAEIIAMPYIEASQSGILATAYAFQKPVVVTKVGSLPEVVDDGKTGLLIEPNDPVALAEAIIKLASNKELREKMKIAVRHKVEKDLSWEAAAQRLFGMYQAIIEGNFPR